MKIGDHLVENPHEYSHQKNEKGMRFYAYFGIFLIFSGAVVGVVVGILLFCSQRAQPSLTTTDDSSSSCAKTISLHNVEEKLEDDNRECSGFSAVELL